MIDYNNLRLHDKGEKNIIKEIILGNELSINNILPLNDDCQALSISRNKYLLITTDRTPSGLLPYQWGIYNLFNLGRYNATSNLSDIAAMGANPIGFLLNIAAPRNMKLEAFKEVFNGIGSALMQYRVPLLGGDTKEGSELNLVGIALGFIKKGEMLKRSEAKTGDYLIISKGNLGLIPAAIKLFNNDGINSKIITDNEKCILFDSYLNLKANIYSGRVLSKSRICNSCMDNSDGILSSLIELSEASNVGFDIKPETIKITPLVMKIADHFRIEPLQLALGAGGDFKLIATVSTLNPTVEKYFQCIGFVNSSKKITIKGKNISWSDKFDRYNHFVS